jgi:hypothetical protein
MSLPILELQFLPPVGYLACVAAHGGVRLEACENFQKSTLRNRCQLLGSQGVFDLSIPLRGGKHQQCPIQEVQISDAENWARQHWRSIETAYRSAPFWLFYADHFAPIFLENKCDRLWDFNLILFKKLIQLFDLQVVIEFTEKYNPPNFENKLDFRNQFLPKNNLRLNPTSAVKYPQIFEDRLGFVADVSAFDLLFCLGKSGKDVFLKNRSDNGTRI